LYALQNAVLGNTAFLVGVRTATRVEAVDILVEIRNNATFDRAPAKFWPGTTQVFVEILPLKPATTPEVLDDPGAVEFTHTVWPKKVDYSAFTTPQGA
jgi:hypothetical protein